MQKQLILAAFFLGGVFAQATTFEDLRGGLLDLWKKPLMTKTEMKQAKKWERSYEDRKLLCFRDQAQAYQLEQTLFKNWKKAWLHKDHAGFQALWLKPGVKAKIFPAVAEKSSEFDGITRTVWSTEPKDTASSFFKGYRSVKSVDLNLVDFTVEGSQREENQSFNQFQGVVEAVIDGIGSNGFRRSDRGRWTVSFEKNEKGIWKMSAWTPLSGESLVASRKPSFKEASTARGLSKLPVYLRTEAIRRGGYALSVSDVNNDGRDDLLVGYRDGLDLLIGTKNGKYRSALKGSGLENLTYVKTAVFADFRNAGMKDLVVTTLRPGAALHSKGASSVYYFRGDGKGHFTKQEVDFGTKRAFLQPMPVAAGDFNNDGYLDFYVGYPGIQDFTILKKASGIKDVQGVYLNDKKGSFTDFTDHFRVGDYQNDTHLFPHSSLAADFDQNQKIDLLIADDRNDLSPIYVNQGGALFRERSEKIGIGNSGLGMSIAIGDYDNDGISDLAWTNVNFTPIQRAAKSCHRMWEITMQDTEAGLRLFKGLGKGKFKEETASAGLESFMGQGAAGLTFLDYDHDGRMDIYLTNGLWSGSAKGDEVGTLFGIYMNSDHAHGLMAHALAPEDTAGFKRYLREVSGHLDYLGNFTAAKKSPPSLAGFQRNQLLHNNGDGTFTDVAFLEGVDSVADGYIAGTILNEKGLPDLILRNGDPGTKEVQFPVVQYFKNRMSGPSNALVMTLEGTRSNRDAIGSFVVAEFKDHKQVQHLVSNSGSLQNQQKLAFYLNGEPQIPAVEIHWPSGEIQVLKNVKPGVLHVQEPGEIQKTTSL